MAALRIAAIVVVLAAPSWAVSPASGPAQAPALDGSRTIGEALAKAGLPDAAAPGAPDTTRAVSSSGFAANADSFVAAVYFSDEVTDGFLGALRVWRFDRQAHRWIQAPSIPDRAGSILDVRIERGFVLVDTHRTPSAGSGLVLEEASMGLLGELPGFAGAAGIALTRDGYGRLTEASRASLMRRALEVRSP